MIKTLSVVAVLTLLAGPVQGQKCEGVSDVIQEQFKVSSGGTLDLDLDAGDVVVTRGNAGALTVRAERCGGSREQLARHKLSADKRGNNVEITSRLDGDRGFSFFGRRRSMRVVIRVTVPPDYNVDFTSGAGNVTISDVVGGVEGQTGAGNLLLTEVRGPVSVSTGSGNISLHEVLGRVELQTGAGNIELKKVEGELDANTGAGNITAEIVR